MRHPVIIVAIAGLGLSASGPAFGQTAMPTETLPWLSGYTELWGGGAFLDNKSGGEFVCLDPECKNTFDGDTPYTYGGEAVLNLNWSPLFSSQLDLIGTGGFGWVTDPLLNPDEETGYWGLTAGLHLSVRDRQSHIAGAFGAVTMATALGRDEFPMNFMAGAEAARFFGNATVYAQAGYFDVLDSDTGGVSLGTLGGMWFVRGVGRYFFSPNTRLQAEIAYGEGRDEGTPGASDRFRLTSWGVELEHRIGASRLSLFAAYDGLYLFELKVDDSDRLIQHAGRLGIRLHFGTGSLFDENVGGATLDLPDFSLPMAYFALFDEFSENI